MRQVLAAGALAVTMVLLLSFAVGASPLMTGRSPSEPISSQISLLHRVLIYAKEGRRRLTDGRWNLSQSKSKLGVELSTDETKQLMACTGKIVCQQYRGGPVFASAMSVIRPDLLVTAKHVFFEGRGTRASASFGRCSFRSYLHRNIPIPIRVDKDQRKSFLLNNENFIVVRLKRALKDCNAFAISESHSSLPEGEQIFSVTSTQRGTLNRLSSREPVVARGKIRNVNNAFFGGPPFYYADIDVDEGGSGGAVFSQQNGRPVSNDEGQLILRGVLIGHGPNAKNGKPYSEERNYTIIVGLLSDFRELVEGKAHQLAFVEHAPCLQDETPEIDVISEAVPSIPPSTLVSLLRQEACSPEVMPEGKTAKANTSCATLAKQLAKLAKGIETLAASQHAKGERQFKLKNDTSCSICFSYDRCNDYGCWDEVVRASGKSTLFAGVRDQAPVVKNPQFCRSGQLLADVRPPPPLKRPPETPPPLPPRKLAQQPIEPEAVFAAAKEKASRKGVWALSSEDIRGLSLEQIRELRGY